MEIFKNVRKQVSSTLDQMKLGREIEALNQLVAENPQNVEALRRLAEAHQAAGNADTAISLFIQLADQYRQTKQPELALAFYRKVERMVDTDQRATILKHMVNIYFETKQFDKAYEHCRQVISLYIGLNQPEAATGFMKMLPEFGERDADYRKELREMIQERDEKWMQGAKATWVDGMTLTPQQPADDDFSDRLVLLVDDEPHVIMILEKIIKPLGCRIVTANNGQEALEKAKQETPSLIISDLMMPKMDGSQLFAAVQQDPKLVSVPFVCLTSRDQEDEKVSAFEKGVEDYWGKPFSVKEIPARVKRLLRRSRPAVPSKVVGTLATTSMIDLLNAFERERKSGVLELTGPQRQTGTIHFRDGTPVDASCGDKHGIHAIFIAVGWKEGEFAFTEQPSTREDVIKMRASDLILEALRRFDEEQALLDALPDFNAVAVLPPGFNVTWFSGSPPDLVRRVLGMVDGRRTVRDCVEACRGDLDLLRLLATLWSPEAQAAREPSPAETLAPQPHSPGGMSGYYPSLPSDAPPLIPQMPPGYPPQMPQQPGPPGGWGQSGTYPSMGNYPAYPPNPYPGYPGYPPPGPYNQPYGNPYQPGQAAPQQPYPANPYMNPGYPVPQQPQGPSANYPTVPLPPSGYPGAPQTPRGMPSSPPKPAAPAPIDVSVTLADPMAEQAPAQKLFEAVVAAKRQCGESLDDFTFQRFQRILVEQTTKIKNQLNCTRVVFSVQVENGRVKFVGKGA